MTGCIIQARLGSTRLPQKVLAPLGGRPMLEHVIARAHKIRGVDRVVVAVPIDDMDTIQQQIRADVWWWGGSADDVLERYHDAAHMYNLDQIVRLTGDCPLLDPAACERVLTAFCGGLFDYVSNVQRDTDGWDCEVFSWDALERAHIGATTAYDREHVTPWMRRWLRCGHVSEPALPAKWSVDTADDLARVQQVLG